MADHLAGKVIIVTGAASGFGKIVAEITAARGAKVVAADIDPKALTQVVASMTQQGHEAIAVTTDVTDSAQTDAMAKAALDTYGRIDVLINNAGTMPLAFWSDHKRAAEAWSRCIDINFKGVVNGISSVYDAMIANGRGQVVNISSIYGNVSVVGSAVYSATKAAVNVLSESLRAESQGKIKVTVVKPTGVIGTNLGNSIINSEAMIGILGQNMASFSENAAALFSDAPPEEMIDPNNIRYWTISPTELAEQIVYVIDQPWGVSISDITVRASGDQYLF